MKIVLVGSDIRWIRRSLILDELKKHHKLVYIRIPYGWKYKFNKLAKHYLKNADVALYEFSSDHQYMNMQLDYSRPTVIRIHTHEVFYGALKQIEWPKVDVLITPSCSTVFSKVFKMHFSSKKRPKQIIHLPHGIDLNKFKFIERKFKKPYKIGIVGRICERKGIYDLIKMFTDVSDDFVLNIAGIVKSEDAAYAKNCMELVLANNLKDRVKFVGKIDDLPKFYQEQDIIVSNSREELFHFTVGEGMSTGCYPLINAWKDADKVWSKQNIFHTPAQFCSMVHEWGSIEYSDEFRRYQSENAFLWLKDNYDAKKLAIKFREMLEGIAK